MKSSETISNDDPTVFIVDDDEAVRFAVAMLIESCGWQAKPYSSITEFLSAEAQYKHPGCLILDLNMPGLTGADLLDTTSMWLPVIVITGFADSNLAARVRGRGVKAVLKKPFGDQQLIQHVRQAMGLPEE